MLGAFTCYMLVVWYGMGYWPAFALAVAPGAVFGAGLGGTLLRRVIGQPQFAVVMLTLGVGAMFRGFASIPWGSGIYTLPTPFRPQPPLVGGVTIGLIELFSGAYLPQGVKDVAAYVVLLLVLAIRPQGMFGTVGRKKV